MKKNAFRLAGIVLFIVAAVLFYLKQPAVDVSVSVADDYFEQTAKSVRLTAVDFSALNGFDDDAMIQALPALEKSCGVLKNKYLKWRTLCAKMRQADLKTDADVRSFIKENMRPYAVNDGQSGLFTGYFQPETEASLHKKKGYDTPIYGLPDDAVSIDLGRFNPKYKGEILFGKKVGKEIRPYATRREIETGAVKMPAKVLAWAKEPVDLFMMQIQGSGILKLPDGKRVSLGYAGNNGYSFTGIGSVMAKKGLLKNGVYTMPEIKDWLIANPEQAQSLMYENKRYIFFKRQPETDAVGAMKMTLTAGRSLAVDMAYIPLGSFLWLETTAPDGKAMNRLVTAQDTGTAIKGAVRGDFFWGTGDDAFHQAGRMKSKGTYFILIPVD